MARLAEALLSVPAEWTLEGEWQRRNTAADTIVGYCDYEEGGPFRGRSKGKRTANHVDRAGNNNSSAIEYEVKKFSNEGVEVIKTGDHRQKEEEI